jgi:hypothetical protein
MLAMARVLGLTILFTLLSFAVSLLLGIVGVALTAMVRGAHPNMPIAYRDIALPVAISAAAIAIVAVTILEIRHYRACKALAAIENAN